MPFKAFINFLNRRVVKTIIFACQGLMTAFTGQEAFRLEVAIFLLSIPLAFFVAQTNLQIILLVGVGVLVLIVELLNTAIELVIDRIGTEFNKLSGQAKDVGSSAVLLSLLLYAIVWTIIIMENFLIVS
jgi:diacylglycerol kinase (ATP)